MTREQRKSQRPDARQASGDPWRNAAAGSATPMPAGNSQRSPAPPPAIAARGYWDNNEVRSDPAGTQPRAHPMSQSPHPQPDAKPRDRRWKWLTSWKLWLVLMLLVPAGSGLFALAVLLRLPGTPNCPAVFWPLAPASLRFECARLAASKFTTQDLLEAIALVDSLPPDHPLREEADRMVEAWSEQVLRLAEDLFHAGKLNQAIAAARQIPGKASSARLVDNQVLGWQTTWSQAEEIYRKAEVAMRQLQWRDAFNQAVRLLDVDNRYWQTTRYDDLNRRINISREDGNKFYRAERLARGGGLSDLLAAIKLAESIRQESYVYDAAQKLIPKYGQKMIDLAQESLDRRNLQDAMHILNKIPPKANLQEPIKDFTALANAQSRSWENTVTGLEEAITQAQRIAADRPLYAKAQERIRRWQLEIGAIAQLERARMLAQGGTIADLAAAISEAYQVPQTNPRWREVQQQIGQWQTQIQTIEDRPILSAAEAIASQGDLNSLYAAIEQAKQIPQGRVLYREARSKIGQWAATIQTTEDQPILDQAQQYAQSGDLPAAIALVDQIGSGRALYTQAKSLSRSWRDTLQAEQRLAQAQRDLQEAQRLANTGSSADLIQAIAVANRVPASTRLRTEAENAINTWSRQLLEVAKIQAGSDPAGAIALVQKIPSRSPVYTEAQSHIATWQKSLGQ